LSPVRCVTSPTRSSASGAIFHTEPRGVRHGRQLREDKGREL
jgi:hypothetical protein